MLLWRGINWVKRHQFGSFGYHFAANAASWSDHLRRRCHPRRRTAAPSSPICGKPPLRPRRQRLQLSSKLNPCQLGALRHLVQYPLYACICNGAPEALLLVLYRSNCIAGCAFDELLHSGRRSRLQNLSFMNCTCCCDVEAPGPGGPVRFPVAGPP